MANISQPRYLELIRAERRLRELEELKSIKPFADKLCNGIGTVLASTPFESWPTMCRTAYTFYAKEMPTAARLYKDRLPQRAVEQNVPSEEARHD